MLYFTAFEFRQTKISLLMCNYSFVIVLLRCDFFQGRLVSISVSMKKLVIGFGFGVYTCAPSIVSVT